MYYDIWSTKTYNDSVGETGIEWNYIFDEADLFGREGDRKCLDVGEHVFHLATSDNWEHVRCLLQDIRDSDCVRSNESI